MSPMVSIKLREQDAQDAAAGRTSGLRRAQEAFAAALGRRKRVAERKAARKVAPRRPRAPADQRGWPTLKLRKAVWERSGGRCENPRCRRRIRWHTFDLDHFIPRGKAEQTPETCWALCNRGTARNGEVGCHQLKHAGNPSRAWWLEAWLVFAHVRFAGSATVALVEGQLQAERAGAELDARRRQRPAPSPEAQLTRGEEGADA